MKRRLKNTQRINETKRWFFEKINKIDKPLAKVAKRKREKTQIPKIRDEEGETVQRWLEEEKGKDL
jgi:hypothetical protein